MNARFHHLNLILCGLCAVILSISGLFAEDITTTEGQFYTNVALRRSGDLIMIKITLPGSTGMAEVGIPIRRIAKVSFVMPPDLEKAQAAASTGNASEVLGITEAFVVNESHFKDLPGSWWFPMAKLRLLALASAGKNDEIAKLSAEIGVLKTPEAEMLSRAGTLFVALSSKDTAAVVVGAQSIPRLNGGSAAALAQFALGRALLLKKDYEGALRALLTIKVFYPSVALLQPAVLLGAANAYVGLEDKKRALQSLSEIVTSWPNAPQASEAKKLMTPLSSS